MGHGSDESPVGPRPKVCFNVAPHVGTLVTWADLRNGIAREPAQSRIS